MLHQHKTAYSCAIKFTRLIPGNVCVLVEYSNSDGTDVRNDLKMYKSKNLESIFI